eukprot:1150028-Pelagomonas_calceolata.AAC.9
MGRPTSCRIDCIAPLTHHSHSHSCSIDINDSHASAAPDEHLHKQALAQYAHTHTRTHGRGNRIGACFWWLATMQSLAEAQKGASSQAHRKHPR